MPLIIGNPNRGGGGAVESVNNVLPDALGNVSLDVTNIPDAASVTDVENVVQMLGDLADLDTTAKGNLVVAINEVRNELGNITAYDGIYATTADVPSPQSNILYIIGTAAENATYIYNTEDTWVLISENTIDLSGYMMKVTPATAGRLLEMDAAGQARSSGIPSIIVATMSTGVTTTNVTADGLAQYINQYNKLPAIYRRASTYALTADRTTTTAMYCCGYLGDYFNISSDTDGVQRVLTVAGGGEDLFYGISLMKWTDIAHQAALTMRSVGAFTALRCMFNTLTARDSSSVTLTDSTVTGDLTVENNASAVIGSGSTVTGTLRLFNGATARITDGTLAVGAVWLDKGTVLTIEKGVAISFAVSNGGGIIFDNRPSHELDTYVRVTP
ncbi:MAG: hypothetical protein LBR63_00835 [Citrobacter amalonaticus]|jgi:hypothetical protein|nr:hypothetical protein [Citrobacter amalonaticus]